LFLTTCRLYMYVTLSVEVIQTDINKVSVFLNDSWRRKWISLNWHKQSERFPEWQLTAQVNFALHSPSVHCRKNSFSWDTGSWNGQYCFGEQWQPGVDIFLWIPPSQNIIRYNRQASIQLISLSPVPVKLTCFDSRSCLPFSMKLETGQILWWKLPHSIRLNYYSLAVAVHLYMYPLPETVSEKLLCLGRLRNLERWWCYAGMDQATLQ